MTVRTDDGRSVRFDLKDYAHIDHGYAATIHKAQGMTVDRTHVLATPGMDAHGSYVALSRHRDGDGPALWRRRLRRSRAAGPHAVTRPRQGHGVGLRADRPGARAMPSGAASRSASAWSRSCAGSFRRSCATGSAGCWTGCARPETRAQPGTWTWAGEGKMLGRGSEMRPARPAARNRSAETGRRRGPGSGVAQRSHPGACASRARDRRDPQHRKCGRPGQSRADARIEGCPQRFREGAAAMAGAMPKRPM